MGNELHAVKGHQADCAVEKALAAEAERARLASLEQQTRARVAEAAKAAALVAEKSRDTVAQGLTILLDSDIPDNPISRLATRQYVDSRIAFVVAEASRQRSRSWITRFFEMFGRYR